MLECVSLKYTDIDSAPYKAHRLGFVPAGNAGLVLYIFIVQAAGNFQQRKAVLVFAENAI